MLQLKIKSAVTDSDGIIKFDRDNKPGITNLISIYAGLTDMPIKDIEAKYEGKVMVNLKVTLLK